jgi:hypothetical protein
LKTPTGLITQGNGILPSVRYTYGGDVDGDEMITVVSALDDLQDRRLVQRLNGITHAKLATHPLFLEYLKNDLTKLQSTRLRKSEPEVRPDDEPPVMLP